MNMWNVKMWNVFHGGNENLISGTIYRRFESVMLRGLPVCWIY